MLKAVHPSACTRCRLRDLVRGFEKSRSRRTAARTTTQPTATSGLIQRRAFSSTGKPLARARGFSKRQEVELIEGLFTSGNISREEWRESVWMQAGLKSDASGEKSDVALKEDASLEEKVRRLREWYSGEEVPQQLLQDEEVVVYERLFGRMRQVQIDEEGIGDWAEMVGEDAGTGVLREAKDGVLEEVEFDEEYEVEVDEDSRRVERKTADEMLASDVEAAMNLQEPSDDVEEDQDNEPFQRVHPLTRVNRFATSPTTLEMPKVPFVDPVMTMLSNLSNTHLTEHAHRVFGGAGLPYSTSTPHRGKLMPQKPVALDAYQSEMSERDADIFMSTLIPGVYSSVMSVLIETRKRLGTAWAEDLVRKAEAGELRILDAGGAGAGVLAVREMLRAEWERMHEDGHGDESPMALAEADGKLGGEGVQSPLGSATVLTGSEPLRKRAAKLLDNTTFVPRLPDYIHTEVAKEKGKFDIVIAPHTLWQLREDYIRKPHVQNLWSLLSNQGGVLLLLEKGVARGFELVAGARQMLLDNQIASPGSSHREAGMNEPIWKDPAEGEESTEPTHVLSSIPKETGMIIAPCTNHSSCPMYVQKGLVKGRRDICSFEQRYHRPPFLQNIFGTKGRNHEDVEFSYISVMRGRDLRSEQSREAADRAFAGFEKDTTSPPNSLSLPRTILPPLKRQGHVIMDVCTPAGALERWIVSKSFSKAAYRDARKSNWGDLWALGAKTRLPRSPTIKKNKLDPAYADLDVNSVKGDGKRQQRQDRKWERREMQRGRGAGLGLGTDEYGRITVDGETVKSGPKRGGQMRGAKVKGIRDKRDKRADGNGRRREREVD